MPHIFENTLVVTLEELVPEHFGTLKDLQNAIQRDKAKDVGIKKIQSGGNGRKLRIDFYSLPEIIQKSFSDKTKKCLLLQFFDIDIQALEFFNNYKFSDNTSLPKIYIEEYTINASVLIAGEKLRIAKINNLRFQKKAICGVLSSVFKEINLSNNVLKSVLNRQHTLPASYSALDRIYKPFFNGIENGFNYEILISKKLKNQNRKKWQKGN